MTHRGLASSFAVITGHHEHTYGPLLDGVPPGALTLVVLMGVRQRAAIAARLVARGWAPSTPAALVMGAATDRAWRWIGPLDALGAVEIPASASDAPGMLVIGERRVAGRSDHGASAAVARRIRRRGARRVEAGRRVA